MDTGHEPVSSPLLCKYLMASGYSFTNWLITSMDLWFIVLCSDALPMLGAIAGTA